MRYTFGPLLTSVLSLLIAGITLQTVETHAQNAQENLCKFYLTQTFWKKHKDSKYLYPTTSTLLAHTLSFKSPHCSKEMIQNIRLTTKQSKTNVPSSPPQVEIVTQHSKKNRVTFQIYLNHLDYKEHAQHARYNLTLSYKDQKLAHSTTEIQTVYKWKNSFLVGANYNVYLPDGTKAEQKSLQGVDINYILHTWDYRNERRGPSLGRLYFQTSLLEGANRDELTVKYGFGIELSFERNPKRNFLVPIFGLETGGIYSPYKQSDLHSYHITPRMGLVLFHNQTLFLSLAGGYAIPFSHLEELRGWDLKAGLHFTLW